MLRSDAVIIVLFLMILFHSPAVSQTIQTSHVSLKEATKETWAPGIVTDNTSKVGGIRFRVSVTARKNRISFDHLIANNEIIPLEITYLGARNARGPFKKNKLIEIIAQTDKQVVRARPSDDIIKLLDEKKLEGVVQYTYKGKKYFFPISVFAKRSGQPLPR